MKTFAKQGFAYFMLSLFANVLLTSCEEDKDSRPYDLVTISAAYINGEKVSSDKLISNPEATTITLDPGTDLTRLKVRLVALNGDLIDFPTDVPYDYSYPFAIKIKSYNDVDVNMNFHIISKPLLSNLFVEGLSILRENIFFGEASVIVQVPTGTPLSALKISMEYRNGVLTDFENGVSKNYSGPVAFQLKGVDGTIYPYQLMVTDQPVGPASIQSITANSAASVDIDVDVSNNVQVYYGALTNFAQAALTITSGYGNELIDFTNGSVVNLYSSPKIKIKGTDGITKEFTFLKPKLKLTEVFRKTPADLGFGADGGASLCFSGDYVVASTHNGTAGIHYYDLTGTKVGTLALPAGVTMGNAATSLRKIASDDKGAILAVTLSAGVNTVSIYKWNSVTDATPQLLCTATGTDFSFTSLRACGINVQGSIDGNAVITVPINTQKTILKWTFENGVLKAAKPDPIAVDNDFVFGYYISAEQYPGKANTIVAGIASTPFGGIRTYVGGATTISAPTTASSTDLRMKTINGRVYLAHTVWGNAKHTFHFKDITDDNEAAYKYNLLWDDAFMATSANGNATVDADFAPVNGKWHVAYLGTNGGVVCYALE